MNYKETLDYLYFQLPMYQRQGKVAFKKNLNNITALCHFLDNPQRKLKCIHVAGTNGKGSVSHMLASALQEHGFEVALYTSPHYKDFRERIKINGKFISRAKVCDFVEKIDPIMKQLRPSFFEITVAMAFDYFASQKVDFAIIETGLGGRLDSTNIITPVLSVITNISFDHVGMLGNTLELIAGEKAGIIKPSVPVVIGKKDHSTDFVFINKSHDCDSQLIFAEDMFHATDISESNFNLIHKSGERITINLAKFGPYQIENIRTTFAALECLSAETIITKDVNEWMNGFENIEENTYYVGRWQILSEKPLTIADSAHNEAGLEIVINKLKSRTFNKMHFVIGFVNDKSLDKILAMLPQNARYYFAKADIPRGLDASKLKNQAAKFGLNGRSYSSVKNAYRAAKRAALDEDLIYIGGSIFVIAELI